MTDGLRVLLLSFVAADALAEVFAADWQNFQENGNWNVSSPGGPHMHLHIYGRRRQSRAQPFGESLSFPTELERDSWRVDRPSPDDLQRLNASVRAEILADPYPEYGGFLGAD